MRASWGRYPARPPIAAFSLIELLVVVSIIAILAGLSFAAFGRVKAAAGSTKCLSNMRQIALVSLQYASDHDGHLPPSIGKASLSGLAIPYNQVLAQYFGHIGDETTFFSPVFQCPSDPRPYRQGADCVRSYSLNGTPSFTDGWGPATRMGVAQANSPYSGRLMSQVTQPSKTILLVEWFTNAAGTPRPNTQASGSMVVMSTGWQTLDAASRFPNGSFYHGKFLNFAFADGHAQAVSPPDVLVGFDDAHDFNAMWTAIRTK